MVFQHSTMGLGLLASALLSGLYFCVVAGSEDVRVQATAPVNPVEQDGIFSIRCQVWNLGEDQEVALVRIPHGGKTERLTLRENVVSSEDERVFIAVRQLEDSSNVYFLSIMRIKKGDAGVYRCAVYGDDSGAFIEITSDSVIARIMYFPSESEPSCEPNGNFVVMAGADVYFNCSSESAFPAVSLTWSRGSPDSSIETDQIAGNGKTYSVLKLRPSEMDSSLVFLCTVSSKAFPDRHSNCHIGPLTVVPNPNPPIVSSEDQMRHHSPTSSYNDVLTDNESVPKQGANDASEIPTNCQQECSNAHSSTFYWVIATIIAAILAICFFLIGLIILLRYCKLQEARKAEYEITRQRGDQQIYAELDGRRGEKVYMYLDKNPKVPLDYTPTHNKEVHEHYGIIPRVPKI